MKSRPYEDVGGRSDFALGVFHRAFVSESELRLPTYDEVRDLPKDPPAYEVLFEARRDDTDPVAPSVPKIVSPEESGRSLLPPHVTDYSAQGIADG